MASVSFTGMSSGLDTDSIVEALCATATNKVTKSEQAEEKITIKQDAWKEINAKIYSFYTGLDKIRMSGNFSSMKTTSSVPGIATIASTANLEEGNHDLNVTQLAEKATLTTSKIAYTLADGTKATAKKSTTLGEILGKEGASDANGVSHTSIMATGKDAKGNTYNTEIKLTNDMTIADLEKELSSALGHCSVKYNESLGTFSVYSKETGAEQEIKLEINGTNQDALTKLGFKQTSATGKNLKATYDGMEIDHHSNNFEVAGQSSTSSIKIEATGIGSTTLSATKNTEGVFDLVKGFVEDYNTLMAEINTLLDAEDTKLSPLTEEEKAEMSEKEIEKHNEKLKASALRNDSTLRSLRDSLRSMVADTLVEGADGKLVSLSSIGITTSNNYKDNGKLILDEDKLKEVIESRPDDVAALFTSRTEGPDGAKPKITQGLATRFYSKLQQSFKGNAQKSTGNLYYDKVLTNNLKSQKKKTATLEEQLETLKQRYYKKFTAMEKMLATINSQSSTIASYLGG